MVILSVVLRALEKVDQAREKAVDDLIARTKYYGMPGSGHVGTEGGWGAVYKTLKDRQDHERRQAEEAWKTKENQRFAEEASRSGTGTNRNVRGVSHRKT